MALRSGYKGIKKLAVGLKWNRPGILAADDTALAKVFFPRSEQAVLGAKNILNIDSYSLTANGTTVTNITGGKNIKVSNTAWQYAGADFVIANPYKGLSLKFDCDADYVAGTVGIVLMTNSSASASGATTIATSGYFTEDKHVSLDFNGGSANYFIIRFILNGSEAGAGEVNVTNMMISFDGGEYVPHAMTNKELTEKSQNIDSINTVNTYNLTSSTSLNFNLPSKEGLTLFIVSGFDETRNGMYVCRNNAGNRILFPIKAQSDVTITIEQATGAVSVTSTANAVLTVMNFKS